MTIIEMDAVVGRMLRRLVLRMMTITTMTIIAILTRTMMMMMMTGGGTTADKSVKSNNDRGHKLSPPRWWWGWWPTMMMMTKLSPPRRWWGPKLWRSIFSIDEANSFLSRLLFIWYLYDILADYNPNHNITDCHSEKKKRKICAGLEVDGHDWTFADCVTCALIASLSTRRLHLYNGLWG